MTFLIFLNLFKILFEIKLVIIDQILKYVVLEIFNILINLQKFLPITFIVEYRFKILFYFNSIIKLIYICCDILEKINSHKFHIYVRMYIKYDFKYKQIIKISHVYCFCLKTKIFI